MKQQSLTHSLTQNLVFSVTMTMQPYSFYPNETFF